MKVGVNDVKKLLKVMDPGMDAKAKKANPDAYAAAYEIAEKMLSAAWEIYEEKAKYVVVGQLYLKDGKAIKQWDPACEKVALGPFSSPGEAQSAVFSLSYSIQKEVQGDEFLTMTIPYRRGTAADFHKERVAAIKAEQMAQAAALWCGNQAERLSQQMASAREPCPMVTPNDDMDFVPCVREKGHAGHCFTQYPESWGLEVVDGVTRVRQAYDERNAV